MPDRFSCSWANPFKGSVRKAALSGAVAALVIGPVIGHFTDRGIQLAIVHVLSFAIPGFLVVGLIGWLVMSQPWKRRR